MNVLGSIPFIGGYEAQKSLNQQRGMGEIQQAAGLMGLLNSIQAQQDAQRRTQDDQAMKQILSQTGGDIPKAIQALVAQGPQGIRLAGVLAEATKDLRNPPQRGQVVAPGGALVDPTTGQVIYQGAPKNESKTRVVQIGEEAVTQELMPDGSWKEIGRGPKFARSVAPHTTIHNPAPVTMQVIQDKESPTGWSAVDARGSGRKIMGVPPPNNSDQGVDLAGRRKLAEDQAKKLSARRELVQDMNTAITQLAEITKDGGLIDQSTGSGIGAAVDRVAGFVGKATPGAIAVSKLKPVFDIVLKMVPRFEGPQSDKDTLTYKEAAGQLADPNIPNPQKKEAGKVILDLMKKRRGQFQLRDNPDSSPPVEGGVKFLGFE